MAATPAIPGLAQPGLFAPGDPVTLAGDRAATLIPKPRATPTLTGG